MKLRDKSKEEKIELQMTPMIDIVFQLLVFFVLTFKVVAQEADFNIRMPSQATNSVSDVEPQTLKVRLVADPNGNLSKLTLDGVDLGNGDEAYNSLHAKVRSRIKDAGGPTDTLEVEFDADYDLKYNYVIRAVDKISGYRAGGDSVTRLIEKVRFAKPRPKK